MRYLRAFYRLIVAVLISAALCSPVQAASQTWSTLTPAQKEALTPIAHEWDKLPARLQKRLLSTTKSYPKLNSEQKQSYQTKLPEWVKLSQEQRNKAREKHKVYSKLPPEKREEVKRKVQQGETAKIPDLPSSGVSARNAKP